MSELLSIITQKKDWQLKIKNPEIKKKWTKELKSQGLNKNITKMIFKLLDKYVEKSNNMYDTDDDYDWFIDLSLNNKEYTIVDDCKCECYICQDNEYCIDSDNKDEILFFYIFDENKIKSIILRTDDFACIRHALCNASLEKLRCVYSFYSKKIKI